jgi:hypothetical protein
VKLKMPGGDRTGPLGRGPMTGRLAGFCASYQNPGYANPGFGRGLGRGFGRGYWGHGRGFWGREHYLDPYYQPSLNKDEEKRYLESTLKILEEEIKAIRERIKEISKEKKETL